MTQSARGGGKTPQTSFRLTAEARTKLSGIAAHMGLSRTAVMEYLIRMEHLRVERGRKR